MSTNRFFRWLPVSGVLVLLAACGGSDPIDSVSVGGFGGGSGSGGGSGGGSGTRDIAVSVDGLGSAETLTLNVGDQQLSFTGAGSQTLQNVSAAADVEASFDTVPAGQNCFFLPSLQSTITVSSDVQVQCGSTFVNGTVLDFVTSAVPSNLSLSLSRSGVADTAPTIATDGSFSVDNPAQDEELVVVANARGYAPNSIVVTPTAVRPFVTRSLFLKPVDDLIVQDPTQVMSFVYDGQTILTVSANGLLAEGVAPVGMVTAEITILDASGEPAILPGTYELANDINLENFGGLAIRLFDEEGTQLSLAGGASATLSVPVASSLASTIEETQIGEAGTIYRFNSVTGAWESPIAATLGFEGVDWSYSASITSLSDVFMIGAVYAEATISGCVADSLGNRIAGVPVVTQGLDYIGLNFTTTDENGNYIASAKANSESLVYALDNTRSQTITVTNGATIQVLDDCNILDDTSTVIELTWGENPSDLDSQLFGPNDTNERFHVSFRDRDVTVNGVEMFLDVDDTTSFGPEVTTVPSFPLPGTYEFLVDLFAGTGTITNSPARVEVNMQGQRAAFSPPSSGATRCWHVFNMTVDDNLRGTLVPVNTYIANRDVCTSTGTVGN